MPVQIHIITAQQITYAVKKRREVWGVAINSKSSSSFLSSLCLKRDNRKRKEEEDGMALCISTENADGKKYVIEIEGKW